MQWCNHVNLQPEQSGGQGSLPCRAPPLEHRDKQKQTGLSLLNFGNPRAGNKMATSPSPLSRNLNP